MAAACSDGTLRLIDLASATSLYQIDDIAADHLAFAPDGQSFAAAGALRGTVEVAVWDTATGILLRLLYARDNDGSIDGAKPVTSLAWSSDCAQLAAASQDGCVRVWQQLGDENCASGTSA